MTLVNC